MSAITPRLQAEHRPRIGHVNLSVSDLHRSVTFYEDVLNMKVTKRMNDAAFLSFGDYHHDVCVNTWHSKGGMARPKGTTGLYHFAITYNSFSALQEACHRVCSPDIDEVVDHGLSISIYLRDPDQNGIELYWDRPVETWWAPDGALRMGHRRIALSQLLEAKEPWHRES